MTLPADRSSGPKPEALASSGGKTRWERVQNETEGPQLLFTPMAILDFDPDSKRMRLKSVHPGYSADDVQKNTGFELIMPKTVPTTEAPTAEELFVLRRHVDRDGVLKGVRATIG